MWTIYSWHQTVSRGITWFTGRLLLLWKGILEVKCPFCIANDIPTDLNLDYLVKINDEATLKTKHSYYVQVQG